MTYKISNMQSDSSASVYVYEKEGKKIPLNSLYSPEKETERFLKKIENLKNHFIIIIGIGNGELLNQLIKSDIFKKNVHFLFIEPFQEVERSERLINIFVDYANKCSFSYFKDFTSITFTKYLSAFTGIPVSIQMHPNYLKADESIIKDCLKVINEGIGTKQVINNTEAKFALDWIIEPLLNIENTAKSLNITKLKGKFEGERAILIASGPSLKDHMDFLKQKEESFHLFSVGSALRALLENDIQPDYVLSMDTSIINYETHFKGLDYNGTLIFETMSNSNIQSQHKGPLIVSRANSDYVTSQVFPDLNSFQQSSPSVAIFTLQVIAYLGFSEIYLVGQDLALVNGEYYAAGVKHHAGVKGITEDMRVLNNIGEQIGTTKALKIYLDIFNEVIQKLPESTKIYNLSKYGAKIEGATYINKNKISLGGKKEIKINYEPINTSINKNTIIFDFVGKLIKLRESVLDGRKYLNRLLQKGIIKSNDMKKVTKDFRTVTKHPILEEIILSRLTFIFKHIINKFHSFDLKSDYSNKDYIQLVKELENFYSLIIKYCSDLVEDKRLNSKK